MPLYNHRTNIGYHTMFNGVFEFKLEMKLGLAQMISEHQLQYYAQMRKGDELILRQKLHQEMEMMIAPCFPIFKNFRLEFERVFELEWQRVEERINQYRQKIIVPYEEMLSKIKNLVNEASPEQKQAIAELKPMEITDGKETNDTE